MTYNGNNYTAHSGGHKVNSQIPSSVWIEDSATDPDTIAKMEAFNGL
ncbi:hypothetical protein [Photobacterium leiognathi]|nr:hypothetical protein [Photobacterium leiognathi]